MRKPLHKGLLCLALTSQLFAPLPVAAAQWATTEEEKQALLPEEETTTTSDPHLELPIEETPEAPESEGPLTPEVLPEVDEEEKPEEGLPPEPQPEKEIPVPDPVSPPKEEADQPTASQPPVKEIPKQETPPPSMPEAVPVVPETPKESFPAFQVTPTKETWAFIQEIGEDARQVGLKNDLYASVMIAQAILESGSGQSQLSQAPYHNLFGIKGIYGEQGVTFVTQEDDGTGNLYTIEATFRKYLNYEASFLDYADLLKNGLTHDQAFYKGAWKSETVSYEEATAFLTGRYATDTQYGEKLNALIEAYALTSYDQEKGALPEGNEELIYPVTNPVVSSLFGPRGGNFHRGVDFAAPTGTPILASLTGTVIRSEYHSSWGNVVAIEHENGLTTLYAHNNQNLVSVGQRVEQGQMIASMGSTGNSTGPHLHFEVSRSPSLAQDQLIDPLTVLP